MTQRNISAALLQAWHHYRQRPVAWLLRSRTILYLQMARLRSPPTINSWQVGQSVLQQKYSEPLLCRLQVCPNGSILAKEAKDAAKAAAESAVEQSALNVAAKPFCRVAVPALIAPLELPEAVIPISGEITDIAEIAATPAIIQGCVNRPAVREIYGNATSSDKP